MCRSKSHHVGTVWPGPTTTHLRIPELQTSVHSYERCLYRDTSPFRATVRRCGMPSDARHVGAATVWTPIQQRPRYNCANPPLYSVTSTNLRIPYSGPLRVSDGGRSTDGWDSVPRHGPQTGTHDTLLDTAIRRVTSRTLAVQITTLCAKSLEGGRMPPLPPCCNRRNTLFVIQNAYAVGIHYPGGYGGHPTPHP